jgi:hypothetical protein
MSTDRKTALAPWGSMNSFVLRRVLPVESECAAFEWPPIPLPGTILGGPSGEEEVAKILNTDRAEWTGDDWRRYAEFLEKRGHELARAIRSKNAALVREKAKKSRRKKPLVSRYAKGTVLTGFKRKKPGPKRKKSDDDLLEKILAFKAEREASGWAKKNLRESGKMSNKEAIAYFFADQPKRMALVGVKTLQNRLSAYKKSQN